MNKIHDNFDESGYLDLSRFSHKRLGEIDEEDEELNEETKRKIIDAIQKVKEGKTQSFEDMIKKIKWKKFSKLRIKEIIENANFDENDKRSRQIREWENFSELKKSEVIKINEIINELETNGHSEKNMDISILNKYVDSLWS